MSDIRDVLRLKENTLSECAQYIKAISEISSTIIFEECVEDVLELIVRKTVEAAGFETCSFWLVDESVNPPKMRLKASHIIDRISMKDRCLDMSEGVIGSVASTGNPCLIRNIYMEPRIRGNELERESGLASMASVPLQTNGGRVLGVFNCFTATPHDFTETEFRMITTMAHYAVMMLLNTKLAQRAEKLTEELETRKQVEKAKDILMRKRNISGEDAFRWIQKRSMNSRRSMREVAESVILSEELGYYSSIPHAIK
jgi:signal transduction protein with GAF and PtsI domain